MPQPNTRVVILGTPKADKEFTLFDNSREKTQAELRRLGGDAEKLARELQRKLRRGRGRRL